jgi:hypothetical protein
MLGHVYAARHRAMEPLSARHGDALVVSPRGRIDHASAEASKAALGPHLAGSGPGRPRVLDLKWYRSCPPVLSVNRPTASGGDTRRASGPSQSVLRPWAER